MSILNMSIVNTSVLKTTLLAAVAVAGFSSVASALDNSYSMYFRPDGQVFTMPVGSADHAKMMKMGRPLPMGAMIYRSGDKLYLVEDKKQGSDTMLRSTFTDLLKSY